MNYSEQKTILMTGDYIGYLQRGYVFHLENDAIIDFDQINFKILEEFDLKSNQFKNTTFEIV